VHCTTVYGLNAKELISNNTVMVQYNVHRTVYNQIVYGQTEARFVQTN